MRGGFPWSRSNTARTPAQILSCPAPRSRQRAGLGESRPAFAPVRAPNWVSSYRWMPTDIESWFDGYLEAFGAYAPGDTDDPKTLLGFYNVPLLLTTDDGLLVLATENDVTRAIRQQVEAMRAASYERSDVLESDVTVLNRASILYHGDFSRRRRDGSEIQRLQVTYLVAQASAGPRIAALAVH